MSMCQVTNHIVFVVNYEKQIIRSHLNYQNNTVLVTDLHLLFSHVTNQNLTLLILYVLTKLIKLIKVN